MSEFGDFSKALLADVAAREGISDEDLAAADVAFRDPAVMEAAERQRDFDAVLVKIRQAQDYRMSLALVPLRARVMEDLVKTVCVLPLETEK